MVAKIRRTALYVLSLLTSLAFAADAAAQTINVRKSGSDYVIEASSAPEQPAALQVSHNMRLWIDLRENVTDAVSVPLDHAGEWQRYYRLVPQAEPAAPIRIMLLGDSMAADCCGWGSAMPDFLKENATFINYAEAWKNTRAFLDSPEMGRMRLVAPDYVLLNFAWSDGGAGITGAQFRENLTTLGNEIRGFNGTPIFLTLHANRHFDTQGRLDPWEHQYNWIIREVAAALNAPLIDTYPITRKMFESFGPTGTAFFRWEPGGPEDTMHVSQLGAKYFARLFLREAPLSLAPYLKGIFDTPPAP